MLIQPEREQPQTILPRSHKSHNPVMYQNCQLKFRHASLLGKISLQYQPGVKISEAFSDHSYTLRGGTRSPLSLLIPSSNLLFSLRQSSFPSSKFLSPPFPFHVFNHTFSIPQLFLSLF